MTTGDGKILEMTEFGPLVETEDGSLTIRHSHHGQDFHSSEGAWFEAWELYVRASGFEDDLRQAGSDITVMDIGMGLGYNAAATLAAWYDGPGVRGLRILSLEIDPRLPETLAGGNAPWCRGWKSSWLAGPKALTNVDGQKLLAEVTHPVSGALARWEIWCRDGSQISVDEFPRSVNYFWQDPFTPELNPAMWSEGWFGRLRLVAAKDAKLMTYSVSRAVKDALGQGGWRHERFRTPGRKRHWLRAIPG